MLLIMSWCILFIYLFWISYEPECFYISKVIIGFSWLILLVHSEPENSQDLCETLLVNLPILKQNFCFSTYSGFCWIIGLSY